MDHMLGEASQTRNDHSGNDMAYFDLGSYSRKVTASSPDAQLWFDRGLNWLFGFNHGEAIKCFQKALKHDPECAMAHWGVSYASGPNYNLPWYRYDPHGRQMALSASYDAMQSAFAHAGKASPVEQAMIHALTARYPQREAIEDMAPWDKAYTKEMRKVFEAYPDDLEVRTVFAELIMNETPWEMWDLRSGKPAEGAGTEECRAVLEYAFNNIRSSWDHPGLLHLYVHLMEMSPFPQRALRAGDRLREIAPDSATSSTCRRISTSCAGITMTSLSTIRRRWCQTANSSAIRTIRASISSTSSTTSTS